MRALRRVSTCGFGSATLFLLLVATSPGAFAASTSTTTTSPTSSATNLTSGQPYYAAIWALVFGLLGIVAVLGFLLQDRTRSFRALGTQSKVGPTTVDDESALAPAPFAAAMALLPTGDQSTLSIIGPAQVNVGEATSYVAVNYGDTLPTWKAAGDATLSASTGGSVRVTAQTAGALILTATSGTQMANLNIMASAPKSASAIPFLGSGYGSVVVALSVASVTAALGLTNIINGQAVAGILGSLVTYTVARAAGSSSDSGSTTGTSTSHSTKSQN